MKILAFGIAREILNSTFTEVAVADGVDVSTLKNILEQQYPGLKKLSSYMLAVNSVYATDMTAIHNTDEVAIIPPVSGG